MTTEGLKTLSAGPVTTSEPSTPHDHHLASLPAQPGAEPLYAKKSYSKEGVEVAMARKRQPGDAGVATEGAMNRDLFLGGGAAGISAAAAAKVLMDRQRNKAGARGEVPPAPDSSNRQMIDKPFPPSPGFEPPDAPLPDRTESPASPPQAPHLEGFPEGEKAKAQLFIFEELHDDLKRSLTKPIENRKGDAYTQRGNELVAGPCLDALKAEYEQELQERVNHFGGAKRASDGIDLQEAYLPEKNTKGKKGSSFADVALKDELTGDRLYINTAKTLKDGKTPVAEERRNLYKMRNNANLHDVVAVLPKLRPGMDEQEYINRCIDLLREPYYQWMGRPKSK